MRRPAGVLLAVLLASGLAGCVEAGDESDLRQAERLAQEERARSEPVVEVDETRPVGSLEGQVLDDEAMPVGNASVLVIGLNATARTTSGGAFRFGALNTGDYLMVVRHPQFIEKKTGVLVRSDETIQVTIVLERIPPPVAYVDDSFVFGGYISVAAQLRLPLTLPTGQDRVTLTGSSGAVVPEEYRTRATATYAFDEDWRTIQAEADWTPSTGFAQNLQLVVRSGRFNEKACTFDHDLLLDQGAAPLRTRVDLESYEAMRAEDPQLCSPAPGDKGTLFFDVEPFSDDDPFAAYLEQRFTVYATTAYRAALPPDYSRIP